MNNKTQKCKGCKKEISAGKETGFCNICYARDYRKRNKDKIKPVTRKYYETHKEESKERLEKWRDKTVFGGNAQKAFERDNWECRECSMSQEQSLMLFNRKLVIHHKDGQGRNSEVKNHDLDNLITLCPRCHGTIHNRWQVEERWGDLLEQNESKWKFPKIRELVETEIRKGFGVQESKRIVSKETGLGFCVIDHSYYKLKTTAFKPKTK